MSASEQQSAVSGQPLAGKYEVEFKLGNLTATELQMCAALKELLCDPALDHLRWALNQGCPLAIRGGAVCVLPAPLPPLRSHCPNPQRN